MPEYFGFAIWWCCLHPYERTVSQTLLAMFASLQGFITKADYELLWIGVSGSAGLKRPAAYVATYYLLAGVYDPSGEDPVDVYYFVEPFWFPFLAFVVSPESACPDGCKVLNFP